MSSSGLKNIPLTCFGVSLRPLNPKQRLFVIKFFETMNESEAARIAGYKQPHVKGAQLLKDNKVSRVVEKIQRAMGRKTELDIAQAVSKLADALNRSPSDIVDNDGNLITDLRKLPPQVAAYFDGIDVDYGYDSETGARYIRKVKHKLMPTASSLDMALKVTGAYSPEKTEQVVSFDWGSLESPPADADEVEKEIENLNLLESNERTEEK